MKLEDKLITLEDDKQYMVFHSMQIDERLFVYLMNRENKLDTMFKEITMEGDTLYVDDIDKTYFLEKVFPEFIKTLTNNKGGKTNE